MNEVCVTGWLMIIIGLVLALSFLSKRLERKLEAFPDYGDSTLPPKSLLS